jgi:hypothetical protein
MLKQVLAASTDPDAWGMTLRDMMWANLVPLSGPGNASKGNLTWDKVRERLKTESGHTFRLGLVDLVGGDVPPV